MRHYLLTWYGITDLRASLGLERTGGPVLNALANGNYTDVVILAYTDPSKEQKAFSGRIVQEWKGLRQNNSDDLSNIEPEVATRFVDAASNTESGHRLFKEWLNKKLRDAGTSVSVSVMPYQLKQLNDARGIFKAATKAIRLVLHDSTDSNITCYISPGTPIMAFTWALIARSNPQLKINVIASSNPNQAPETIDLPKELLQPSIRQSAQSGKQPEYDVVIHLLGDQKLPIFFGARQFDAPRNIFITTNDHQEQVRSLSKALEIQIKPIIINDPFRPGDTRKAVVEIASKFPAGTNVAVNMTGGTKLMFAGALSACWESGLEPFYLEIRHHDVVFLRDGSTMPFVGIKDVEDFFKVSDLTVATPGYWEDNPAREARIKLTGKLWRNRKYLGSLYSKLRKDRFPKSGAFEITWSKSELKRDSSQHYTFKLNNEVLDIPDCDDFPEYISGGWLEEYVYTLLRPLEAQGIIRDIRIGLEGSYVGNNRAGLKKIAQEFDCVFTDGKRLWVIECKAGNVTQEQIQKLENITRQYGGVAARGILISSFPATDVQRERIRKLGSMITLISGDKLSTTSIKNTVQSR
jgi:hypothetical protein